MKWSHGVRVMVLPLGMVLPLLSSAEVQQVVSQTFDNAKTGTVSSVNGWVYSTVWEGLSIGNYKNTNTCSGELTNHWSGLSSAASVIDGDASGNSSRYLSIGPGANYTLRPLFSLPDTNSAAVFEMRYKTPPASAATGQANQFIWDDQTNKLWYFNCYAEDPVYGTCLIWNSGSPTASSVMGSATNLPADTWYDIRVVWEGTDSALSDSGKLAVYFGESLAALSLIYEGAAVSGSYVNPAVPRLRLSSVQTNAGMRLDDVRIELLDLADVSVSLTGTNAAYRVDDVLTGSYTYTGNDCGAETGTVWTLWRASDSNMLQNKTVVLAGTNSVASSNLFSYTLSSADFGKYMQLEVRAAGEDLPGPVKRSAVAGPVLVWNPLYNAAAEAPVLIQPINDFNLTDVALSYSWWRVGTNTSYEIQISDDASFTNQSTQSISYDSVAAGYCDDASDPRLQMFYMPDTLLATNRWFWRVRTAPAGQSPGPWSSAESFIVNDSHPASNIVRRACKEDPMFVFEGWVITDFEKYSDVFPADVRTNCALTGSFRTESRWVGQQSCMEWLRPAYENGIQYYFMLGSHVNYIPLSTIEWVFQNYPNVLGIQFAEFLWDLSVQSKGYSRTYLERAAILSAKYGKQIIWADGEYSNFRWQWILNNTQEVSYAQYDGDTLSGVSPVIMEHGDYFVLQHKANIFFSTYASEGALQGAWLAGRVGELGYMPEPWYWADFFLGLGEFQNGAANTVGSVNFRRMPGNFWNMLMLKGLMQGASVFNLTGQFNISYYSQMTNFNESVDTAVFFGLDENDNIVKTATYEERVIPFIRAVLTRDLVLSKQQVLDATKVAVDQGETLWQPKKYYEANHIDWWFPYGPYDALYRNTFGFKDLGRWLTGEKYEIIPNTGRYVNIPLLPAAYGTLPTNIQVVALSNLQSAASVSNAFASAYPQTYTGDAYCVQAGNVVAIMSSSENEDVTQSYAGLPIHAGVVESLSGTIGPHAYILGQKGDGTNDFWLQTCGDDTNRLVEFSFVCSSKPVVSVQPAASLAGSSWDYESRTQHIVISYENGTAEVALRADPDPQTAVVDNGESGYAELSGTWGASSLPGYNGSSSRFSNSSGASVQWNAVLSNGVYRVYFYKIVHSANDPAMTVDVSHALGVATTSLNCTAGTNGWVDLGAYVFTQGTNFYVRNTQMTASKYIRADAVKFVREADVVIVDNGDAGYSEISGIWGLSGLKGYNNSSSKVSNTSGASARWTPGLPSGIYDAYFYKIVYASNDPDATYTIGHTSGVATQYVDCAAGSTGWTGLGTFEFTGGTNCYIRNTLNTAAKYARADAVMFVGRGAVQTSGNTEPVADAREVTVKVNTWTEVTLSASDVNGDPLAFEVVSLPTGGTLAGAAPNLAYIPDDDFTGEDAFTFRVHDGLAFSDPVTVSVCVTNPLPSPFIMRDIGVVSPGGDGDYDDPVFTLSGSSRDGAYTNSFFRYAYQLSSGDCEIRARVVSISTNADDSACAGVMIRDNLKTNAMQMAAFVSPVTNLGVSAQWRLTTGGTNGYLNLAGEAILPPYWVRVVRSNSTFTAYCSPDGEAWTVITNQVLNMVSNAYIGMAVSSHDTNETVTAEFDGVLVTP